MTLWCVCDAASGDALGVYYAGEPAKALDALAQDRGFPNFAAWASTGSVNEAQFAVAWADMALHFRGKSMFGSNYEGWRWYDDEKNEALLVASGQPEQYEVLEAACGPQRYRTIEQCALAALQVPASAM